jgi:hypothetical protein
MISFHSIFFTSLLGTTRNDAFCYKGLNLLSLVFYSGTKKNDGCPASQLCSFLGFLLSL